MTTISRKNLWKSYFILSACGPLLLLKTAKPSSRYKPMFFELYLFKSWESKKLPTSSHTSAPFYAPIALSNNSLFCFINACCLLKSKDFLEWLIMRLSSSNIFAYDSGHFSAFTNIFRLMIGRSLLQCFSNVFFYVT